MGAAIHACAPARIRVGRPGFREGGAVLGALSVDGGLIYSARHFSDSLRNVSRNEKEFRYGWRMARKVIHQLVDDLDGTVLEPGEGETVLFSLDGKSYEIDLTEQNAEKLREVISPYIGAARRTLAGSAVKAPQRTAVRRLGKVRDLSAVRKWAREQGHTVSDRGRVPEAILEAYDAAH